MMPSKKPSAEEAHILGSAVSGAKYLVFLTAVQRILSFALNQVLLRHVTPDVFGVASVKLELIVGTSLFMTRECFRLSLLRGASILTDPVESPQKRAHVAKIVNLAWLSLPLCFTVASSMAAFYIWQGNNDDMTGFCPF